MNPAEITEKLQLNKLRDRIWYVVPSCATTGEGLFEGLVSITPLLHYSPVQERGCCSSCRDLGRLTRHRDGCRTTSRRRPSDHRPHRSSLPPYPLLLFSHILFFTPSSDGQYLDGSSTMTSLLLLLLSLLSVDYVPLLALLQASCLISTASQAIRCFFSDGLTFCSFDSYPSADTVSYLRHLSAHLL